MLVHASTSCLASSSAALPRGLLAAIPAARASRLCAGASNSSSGNGGSSPSSASSTGRRSLLASGSLLLAGGAAMGERSVAAAAGGGSEVARVLDDPKYPEAWPFSPEDFARYDESPDGIFYSYPRLVTHIDKYAIGALTKFYAENFPPSGKSDTAVLDICSSWVSHYPPGFTAGKVAGLGMNGDELKENKQLTEWVVQDLNKDPKLPFADNTFDVITNCVSVDYLNKPFQVFEEMRRVMKPGGKAYMSFSNRCFPTKATQLWTSTSDVDHVWIVGAFYHFTGGWTAPQVADISPNPGRSDPMYVVSAAKEA